MLVYGFERDTRVEIGRSGLMEVTVLPSLSDNLQLCRGGLWRCSKTIAGLGDEYNNHSK